MFSLTGAYRRVFIKPENFTWKFMKYQGQNADLIISDYSKMLKDPEPQDEPEGEHKALILDFVLPPSAYATMALREVMKCDTSVGHHINLDNEAKKAENHGEKRVNEDDQPNGNSEAKKLKTETESKI
jgi:tRNA pseudouridine13 synthase